MNDIALPHDRTIEGQPFPTCGRCALTVTNMEQAALSSPVHVQCLAGAFVDPVKEQRREAAAALFDKQPRRWFTEQADADKDNRWKGRCNPKPRPAGVLWDGISFDGYLGPWDHPDYCYLCQSNHRLTVCTANMPHRDNSQAAKETRRRSLLERFGPNSAAVRAEAKEQASEVKAKAKAQVKLDLVKALRKRYPGMTWTLENLPRNAKHLLAVPEMSETVC